MSIFQRYLGEHIRFGPVVLYGFNAMHVAVNIRTRRWGYICFHPPTRMNGHWWPWYFYVSPDATPFSATYGIGPGYWNRVGRHSGG